MHPLLLLTHWIFRSLTLPYKSSSHSAKCVRCASLRSGGRRLSVRIAMGCQIGALPRTPFPASRDFPSRGNERYEGKNGESYTSCTIPEFPPLVAGATTLPGGKHVTGFAGRLQLPYESSSFATPAVRWGGKRKAP